MKIRTSQKCCGTIGFHNAVGRGPSTAAEYSRGKFGENSKRHSRKTWSRNEATVVLFGPADG